MSINPLLLPVKKDAETIRKTVLLNITKMLIYRKWMNADINPATNMIPLTSDDSIYKIKINSDVLKNNIDNENEKEMMEPYVIVKIIHQNITGINKAPEIPDFLTQYKKYHKIIIVNGITDKAKSTIDKIPNTEVFIESFFMINLMEYCGSPQYEVLTPEETTEFLTEYLVTRRKLCKMDVNDPASRYLRVQKGQIVRIIRPSEITGESIGYRVIVNKGMNKV